MRNIKRAAIVTMIVVAFLAISINSVLAAGRPTFHRGRLNSGCQSKKFMYRSASPRVNFGFRANMNRRFVERLRHSGPKTTGVRKITVRSVSVKNPCVGNAPVFRRSVGSSNKTFKRSYVYGSGFRTHVNFKRRPAARRSSARRTVRRSSRKRVSSKKAKWVMMSSK